MNILVKNIRGLVSARDDQKKWLAGEEMAVLPVLPDAWLLIENGIISRYGTMSDWPGVESWHDLQVIDAVGKYVFPSWCDSHTHIVFAGSRENEFVDRLKGMTYEEIAARGGGILNSAKKLAETSEEDLFSHAWNRLDDIMRTGTGAVEIKSGYGLSVESELKILRVIRKLKEDHPLTIRSTFLGAHAIPAEYKSEPGRYVNIVINEMIPQVAAEKLADFIDVFCEKNYFSPADMDRILEAGVKNGLIPKVHVNQFNVLGGVGVAVNHHALSVDHLEHISAQDIAILKNSGTMPVALPGCSFFIDLPYTPGRQMVDEGLPLAIASDFNPGSSPSGNMNFVVTLACLRMKLTPAEAINAATINGAYAMGISGTHGSITPGKKANVFITREMNSVEMLPYYFGTNLVETAILDGKVFVPC